MNVYPGRVVYSKAGRDKNRPFVVLRMQGENYAYICDGDLRRVDNPKKKKLKHLQITQKELPLNDLPKITDSEIRKYLEWNLKTKENKVVEENISPT